MSQCPPRLFAKLAVNGLMPDEATDRQGNCGIDAFFWAWYGRRAGSGSAETVLEGMQHPGGAILSMLEHGPLHQEKSRNSSTHITKSRRAAASRADGAGLLPPPRSPAGE